MMDLMNTSDLFSLLFDIEQSGMKLVPEKKINIGGARMSRFGYKIIIVVCEGIKMC